MIQPYIASALGSFRILLRDYEILLEYIHPEDNNLDTYSHRSYEILLRACTEFEGLCKEAAYERGLANRGSDTNINTLALLYDELNMEHTEVGVTLWQPTTKYLRPLEGWKSQPHGLTWYKAYNNVKHNRSTQFTKATLDNATHAIAACFLILRLLNINESQSEVHKHDTINTVEWTFPNCSLTFRTPNNWSPSHKPD